jgi:hypothetical protein
MKMRTTLYVANIPFVIFVMIVSSQRQQWHNLILEGPSKFVSFTKAKVTTTTKSQNNRQTNEITFIPYIQSDKLQVLNCIIIDLEAINLSL